MFKNVSMDGVEGIFGEFNPEEIDVGDLKSAFLKFLKKTPFSVDGVEGITVPEMNLDCPITADAVFRMDKKQKHVHFIGYFTWDAKSHQVVIRFVSQSFLDRGADLIITGKQGESISTGRDRNLCYDAFSPDVGIRDYVRFSYDLKKKSVQIKNSNYLLDLTSARVIEELKKRKSNNDAKFEFISDSFMKDTSLFLIGIGEPGLSRIVDVVRKKGALAMITTLNLGCCGLSKFPKWVKEFSSVSGLCIANNPISKVPTMFSFPKLLHFNMNETLLDTLPQSWVDHTHSNAFEMEGRVHYIGTSSKFQKFAIE